MPSRAGRSRSACRGEGRGEQLQNVSE